MKEPTSNTRSATWENSYSGLSLTCEFTDVSFIQVFKGVKELSVDRLSHLCKVGLRKRAEVFMQLVNGRQVKVQCSLVSFDGLAPTYQDISSILD